MVLRWLWRRMEEAARVVIVRSSRRRLSHAVHTVSTSTVATLSYSSFSVNCTGNAVFTRSSKHRANVEQMYSKYARAVARRLLDVCCYMLTGRSSSMFARSCKRGISYLIHRLAVNMHIHEQMDVVRARLCVLAWRGGSAFHLINEVTLRRAGLVLRWVTACVKVNHLGM